MARIVTTVEEFLQRYEALLRYITKDHAYSEPMTRELAGLAQLEHWNLIKCWSLAPSGGELRGQVTYDDEQLTRPNAIALLCATEDGNEVPEGAAAAAAVERRLQQWRVLKIRPDQIPQIEQEIANAVQNVLAQHRYYVAQLWVCVHPTKGIEVRLTPPGNVSPAWTIRVTP